LIVSLFQVHSLFAIAADSPPPIFSLITISISAISAISTFSLSLSLSLSPPPPISSFAPPTPTSIFFPVLFPLLSPSSNTPSLSSPISIFFLAPSFPPISPS
jgi:hypothetical protein